MKRLASLAVALVLVLSMAVPALARSPIRSVRVIAQCNPAIGYCPPPCNPAVALCYNPAIGILRFR